MSALHDMLRRQVDEGTAPGAVGLVARGDDVEVVAVGSVDTAGTAPMSRETIFRIASLTKPITAAAVLLLVEDGVVALADPVAKWLPELAEPVVVRDPAGPVDDVVSLARPITVEDLLSSRAGWGLADDFSLPAVRALSEVQDHGLALQDWPEPDVWLDRLSRIPLLHQPGEAWLYGTSSALQGILVARASGRPLPEFLAERIFAPLGMRDTAFEVPAGERDRFTSLYRPAGANGLELVDGPDGDWTRTPVFPSGGGGLVSTADDLLAFARMLLGGGTAGGRRLLGPGSVRRMTTDHLTAAQRERVPLFLEGQGWGYGGSVDVAPVDPWNVPGRYGWVGGTGTTAHIVPATGKVTILLTQVSMTSPAPLPLMRAFWRATA
ncbi:serine hydrolase domain-containing protein [Streptomyces sp. NPDC018610]|uniref:serine hydrolase domain-containing protein n=1 Tax=Streptomyces sp. NPDC018610 TaxID=3365049 RepID=UPI00378AD194